MHALNVSSSGGVGQGGGGGGGLSNRSANASGDSSSVLSVANGQMIGGANRASMSVASSGNVMQLPLSNRSARCVLFCHSAHHLKMGKSCSLFYMLKSILSTHPGPILPIFRLISNFRKIRNVSVSLSI